MQRTFALCEQEPKTCQGFVAIEISEHVGSDGEDGIG